MFEWMSWSALSAFLAIERRIKEMWGIKEKEADKLALAIDIDPAMDENGWHQVSLYCLNRTDIPLTIRTIRAEHPIDAVLGTGHAMLGSGSVVPPKIKEGLRELPAEIPVNPGARNGPWSQQAIFFARSASEENSRLKIVVRTILMGETRPKDQDIESGTIVPWSPG